MSESETVLNPIGLKRILEAAKNRGDLWSDTAIGELSILSGRYFFFDKNPFSNKYEIKEK